MASTECNDSALQFSRRLNAVVGDWEARIKLTASEMENMKSRLNFSSGVAVRSSSLQERRFAPSTRMEGNFTVRSLVTPPHLFAR